MKNTVKLILLCSMLLACQFSHAQVGLGIKGGIITGSVQIKDLDSTFKDVIEGKNILGMELGLAVKLDLGAIYCRPEAMYNYRSGDVTYKKSNNSSETSKFSIHQLSIPVIFGIKVLGPLAIEAGPVYNYTLSVTEEYNNNNVKINRNGIGYRIGAAADFGPLFLNLSYQGATYMNQSGSATYSEPYRIILGVGLWLNSGKQ